MASRFLILLVRAYQWVLAPLFPPSCRFEPTCSAYAVEALRRHGALAGGWLTARRLVRCNPWGGAGADPVPTVLSPCCAGHRRWPLSSETRR
ncbi:MAG: membrane protein insertion efficiency factor YidD [Alphaproteobacteria bacterium]